MRSKAPPPTREEKGRLMPIIVVARLRLRDPSLLDEFFTHAVAVLEQAQKTDGNLGADAFADAHNVWWDVTAWQSRAPIDEASFVDWAQDNAKLPDWQTSWRRLVADGRSASLANPSAANETRAFPAPVEPPASAT
jgi:hypothetical protein